MKTAEDVFRLMLHTKESYPDADPDLLQELLRMNAEKPKICSNCRRGLAHCVHGRSVTGLEDPPVLAKDVRVRSTGYRGIVTIESLHHRKASRSPYQSNTPEEVGNCLLELILKRVNYFFFLSGGQKMSKFLLSGGEVPQDWRPLLFQCQDHSFPSFGSGKM